MCVTKISYYFILYQVSFIKKADAGCDDAAAADDDDDDDDDDVDDDFDDDVMLLVWFPFACGSRRCIATPPFCAQITQHIL